MPQDSRRGVTLRGMRGNQEMDWTLTLSEWGITTRPLLSSALAAPYLEGMDRIEAEDLPAAERIWRSAAESARTTGDGRLAAWFLDRLARVLAEAGKWSEADVAHEGALAALEEEAEPFAAADLLREWGGTYLRRSAWDTAVERYQKALVLHRAAAPKSLAEARTLNDLGVTAARRGDYSTAEDFLRQALAIREELAPGTAVVTGSLNNLGILARRRGDLARAEEYLIRGEIERLTAELRTRQEDIIARMRRESPRSAAVEYPEPLEAADASAILDPGTVLLEYAVGAERSWLFVVQSTRAAGPGLSVLPIPVGEKALREEVESFRRLLKRSGSERAAGCSKPGRFSRASDSTQTWSPSLPATPALVRRWEAKGSSVSPAHSNTLAPARSSPRSGASPTTPPRT